jgi:ATP-dependent Clp protease ATP-binding subunit ClpA
MIYAIESLGARTIRAALAAALALRDSLSRELFVAALVDADELAAAVAEIPMDADEDRRLLLEAVADSPYEKADESDLLKAALGKAGPLRDAVEASSGRSADSLLALLGRASSKRDPGSRSIMPDTSIPRSEATALGQYAEDMNALAASRPARPVIGRDREIGMLETILLRMGKPNAFLLGDAGVGKTAVVEGLARRIVDGKADPALRSCTVYSLDVGALVGGASLVGAFEERVRRLVAELRGRPDAILFIDEVHMAKGAGAATGSGTDLLESLKKPLGRGEFRAIVATTKAEYERLVSGNKAFARRFQYLDVGEPDRASSIAILESWAASMRAHYGIGIAEEVVPYAVDASAQFVPDRRLPDKAIDVLDYAASKAARSGAGEVGMAHVREAFAELFKVPTAGLAATEAEYFRGLEAALRSRIAGQDDAIARVARLARNARLGLRERDKSLGAALFCGGTGVGKTELARVLSENWFAPAPLVVFHMAEYKERHDAARLVGSAPGLVGYEEGGQLTNAIRRNPNAIVLLDEVDKAHPDVFSILLSIFDKGEILDNRGDPVSARGCFFILTTNLASRESLGRRGIGFAGAAGGSGPGPDAERAAALERLGDFFSPEFLNRLDDVIVFEPLGLEALERVAALRLSEYLARAAERGVDVSCDERAVARWIAERAGERSLGARPVKRLIEREIVPLIAEAALSDGLARGGRVRRMLAVTGGELALLEPDAA